MNPEFSLAVVGSFAEFVLRTTLAFSMCMILSRLLTVANHRFMLWAAFLYGSAAYWIYLIGTLFPGSSSAANAVTSLAPSVRVVAGVWRVPESWAFALGIGLGLLGVIYGLVLAYIVISYANKRRHLRWVMSFATEPPAEISGAFHLLAKGLGTRTPRLRMLSGASSPATFGWLRPVVLLPIHCLEEDESDLEDILLHELHHVRRWDSFWNALATAGRTVLCFHPAAWYAMHKMQFDRELACDLAVVSRSPARRGMYAESLLRFARLNLAQQPASWGIDFAASPDHLTVRVHSILAETRKTSPCLLWLRTSLAVILLAAFVGVAPSLGVLLAYTHPAVSPAVSSIAVPSANMFKEARPARRPRAFSSADATNTNGDVPVSNQLEAMLPSTDVKAGVEVQEKPALSTGPGPHLQRRSLGAQTSGPKSQSIALINEGDSGKAGKHGDSAQAVQQSATIAAALYKRLGDLDRH